MQRNFWTIAVWIAIESISSAVYGQTSPAVDRQYDPPPPAINSNYTQQDFVQGTGTFGQLYLQNMQIWGNRLFQAEDPDGSTTRATWIVAGNSVICNFSDNSSGTTQNGPLNCSATQGNVDIMAGYFDAGGNYQGGGYYHHLWNKNNSGTYTTDNGFQPQSGTGAQSYPQWQFGYPYKGYDQYGPGSSNPNIPADTITGDNGHIYAAENTATSYSGPLGPILPPTWQGAESRNNLIPNTVYPSGNVPVWSVSINGGGSGYTAGGAPYKVYFNGTQMGEVLSSDISGGHVAHITSLATWPTEGFGGSYSTSTPPTVTIDPPCAGCVSQEASLSANYDWQPYRDNVIWKEVGYEGYPVYGSVRNIYWTPGCTCDGAVGGPWNSTTGTYSWTPGLGEIRRPSNPNSAGAGHLFRVVARYANTGQTEPNWGSTDHFTFAPQNGACGTCPSSQVCGYSMTWTTNWPNSNTSWTVEVPSCEFWQTWSYLALSWSDYENNIVSSGDIIQPETPNGFVYLVVSISGTPTTYASLPTPDFADHKSVSSNTWTENNVTWQCVGLDGTNNCTRWTANTRLPEGTLIGPNSSTVIPRMGFNLYVITIPNYVFNYCQRNGEPSWNADQGATYTDGQVVWQECGLEAADVDFRATKQVALEPGFTAHLGCRFHAYLKPTFSPPTLSENWTQTDGSTPKTTLWDNTNSSTQLGSDPDDISYNWYTNISPISDISIDNTNNSHLLWFHSSSKTGGLRELFSHLNYGPYGYFEEVGQLPTQDFELRGGGFWLTNSWGPPFGDHVPPQVANTLLNGDEFDIPDEGGYATGSGQYNDPDPNSSGFSGTMRSAAIMGMRRVGSPVGAAYNDQGFLYTGSDLSYGNGPAGNEYYLNGPGALSTPFHKWGLEWLPDEVRFLVDDRVYLRDPQLGGYDYAANVSGGPVQMFLQNGSTYPSYHIIQSVKYQPLQTGAHKVNRPGPAPQSIGAIDRITFVAFPNPARDELSVHLEVDDGQAHFVTIILYDLLGHTIGSIFSGQVRTICDARYSSMSLPSGSYYCVCSLDGGMQSITKRIQIIR